MMRTLIVYALMLAVISCKKENTLDCFKSTGEQVTEIRYPGQFSDIEVFDKIDVTIIQGSTFKVQLNAGDHLLRNIATTVSDNKLKIKNNNTCNFVRGYKRKITVTITLPVAGNIKNSGVGDIHIDGGFLQDQIGIQAENSGDIYLNGSYKELSALSNGNGDIYLEGSCDRLHVYTMGTNFLHAEHLSVRHYIDLETVSVGDCFLTAGGADTLEVRIWKSGNVYYKGDPLTVIRHYEEKSKGQLIQQN